MNTVAYTDNGIKVINSCRAILVLSIMQNLHITSCYLRIYTKLFDFNLIWIVFTCVVYAFHILTCQAANGGQNYKQKKCTFHNRLVLS